MNVIKYSILTMHIVTLNVIAQDITSGFTQAQTGVDWQLESRRRRTIATRQLIKAIEVRDVAEIKNAIRKGASIHVADESGMSTLMIMAYLGDMDGVYFAFLNGANSDQQDKKGRSALHYAVMNLCGTNIQILRQFIKKNVQINSKDDEGKTALWYAFFYNQSNEIIEFLIQHGAFIDNQDNNGWTMLMHAVAKDDETMVRRLLDCKANSSVKNNENKTAYVLAIHRGKKEIIALLGPAQS